MEARKAPETEADLVERCRLLAGKTLGQVAAEMGLNVPGNLQRHKGWVGQLLEYYLGADAGNQAEPDFMGLGIELKTLPLNAQGQPKESTYVCTVSLTESGRLQWENSWVRKKLAKVLWLPVEADAAIPLADRYVGHGWIWQPTPEQEQQLQHDWEELMDRVVLGEQADITAREGEFLQIRPKAAHSRVMAKSWSETGESSQMNPKGFYLRSSFTRQLLATQFK
ncbi:DNA mismatch repair endonuclease MutH [Methylophaga sp. OBS1]|uniref:DNA mismatch repair endonuclease MutH n=1 Tax=Methylophaga sp. OBS1 TaxID=2991933 RepID=UPI00224EB8ED|nr:DNA mismatch repair endonuclease MutH [Methylophaga sp. OBS1]MCX4193550.1 DNA mismatch repair endonuclease MutH [Methylophaga sp. OBS1]